MRSTSIMLLIATSAIAACGEATVERPDLTQEQHVLYAYALVASEQCLATGQLSAQDGVETRMTIEGILDDYNYDFGYFSRMSQGEERAKIIQSMTPDMCPSLRTGSARRKAELEQNRAMQLHQAQIAAANAQTQAANHRTNAPAPQPQFPVYHAPQVYVPQLSTPNVYHCNRLGSYVVNCR